MNRPPDMTLQGGIRPIHVFYLFAPIITLAPDVALADGNWRCSTELGHRNLLNRRLLKTSSVRGQDLYTGWLPRAR
jgi:hypothetical protein